MFRLLKLSASFGIMFNRIMGKVLLVLLLAAFFRVDSAVLPSTANGTSPEVTPIPPLQTEFDTSPETQSNSNVVSNSTVATSLSPNLTVTTVANKLTDTEVEDMNKPGPTPLSSTASESTQYIDGIDDINVAVLESDDDVDDAGPIQTDGNEDDVGIAPLIEAQIMVDSATGGSWQGQMPAIVAGIFVILCFIGYGTMLMWRGYLERKYGNREMLVNEDFYDSSDLRHFSL